MKDPVETDKKQPEGKVKSSVLTAFDLIRVGSQVQKASGGAKIISELVTKEDNENNLKYVLKRLIRSLGANVPEVRAGYFATLVTLLKKCDTVTVTQILELIKKDLHANGSSKSEVGDVALGQILVCSAVFRSGLILRCTDEEQQLMFKVLLDASKKKSYLHTVAHVTLIDFVKTLDEEKFISILWPHIKDVFKKDFKEHTLDSLYFLMVVKERFPGKVKLKKLIGISDILCEDNIHALCDKLMAGIDFNAVNHPIYKEVAAQIANSPQLYLFWTSGIDSQLVKHNRNRELVSINILSTILKNIKENVEVIPDLISRNFFKLFMDWFKGLQTASKIRNKRDNEDDHKIMIKAEKDLLDTLAETLKSENVTNKIRIETLKKLLFNPGEINFGEVTGTSMIKTVISTLDIDGVKKLAKLLKGVLQNTSKKVLKEDNERSWYNNERVKAAELLSYLVIHDSVKDDAEFKLTYMKLLMCFGCFKIGSEDNVSISGELSGAIKTSFYRCLTSRYTSVDSFVTVLSSLSEFINSILEKEEVRAKLDKQFPKENMECWTLLNQVCQTIEQNEKKSKIDNVFLILLYQLGLFLFSDPTYVKLARSSIKELKSCYEHYRKTKKKKNKVKQEPLSDEPEWIEVLVEVLLSILSAESSALRSVVQCVFKLLCDYLTPSSIGQIVSVIDPDSDTNPLTEGDDSDDNSDDDENEENGDDKQEASEESDSEDEDDDLKTPEQLRMAVQQALGGTADSDNDSIDADMIDEEEGKKIDDALAEAFKQFHQVKGKKTKKDRKDKKMLSDFRIRVLGLIDVYLEKDPSMDICLAMIAPLTRCFEFCIQDNQFNELGNRVSKTIQILSKIRKFSSTDDVTIDILCDYLKSVLHKGERTHLMFQHLGGAVTNFTLFIIHCSQKIGEQSENKKKAVAPIIEIILETLTSYFRDRHCLLSIKLFHSILQLEWQGIHDMARIAVDNMFNSNVRLYRRYDAVGILAAYYRVLNRSPPSEKVVKKILKLEITMSTLIKTFCEEQENLQVKRKVIRQLTFLIQTMRTYHKSSNIDTTFNFQELIDMLRKIKTVGGRPNIGLQNGNTHKQNKKNKRKMKHAKVNGTDEPQAKKVRKNSTHSE